MQPASSARRAADPPLLLARFLPYRLNLLAALVSEGLAQRYAERFGIGVPDWRVLATIGEFGSVTATAIGRHAHMGKAKVSRAASGLAARGLIRRVQDRRDQRAAFLVLTAAGERLYREIVPLAQDYAARLEAGLTPAESAALDALIDKLTALARDKR